MAAQDDKLKKAEDVAPKDRVLENPTRKYEAGPVQKVPVEAQRGENFRLTREQILISRPTTFSATVQNVEKNSILQFSNGYVLALALPKDMKMPATTKTKELRVEFQPTFKEGAAFNNLSITEGKQPFLFLQETGSDKSIEWKTSYFTIAQTDKRTIRLETKSETYYDVIVELTASGKTTVLSPDAPTTFTGNDGSTLQAILKKSLYTTFNKSSDSIEGPAYYLEIVVSTTN
ncbi:MAG: hypothetical protein KDC44_05850 [Phaeodactylibacter sp.]|nr:hypothetical protein [Phaeodactylibacter sp.]